MRPMENYYDYRTGEWVTSGSRYEAVARRPPYDELDDLIILGDEPERAWRLILALLHAVDEDVVDYVGAGPLESFIWRYGAAFADEIEAAARDDERFRGALLDVNLTQGHLPPDVEARFMAAFGDRLRLLPAHDPADHPSDAHPENPPGDGN